MKLSLIVYVILWAFYFNWAQSQVLDVVKKVVKGDEPKKEEPKGLGGVLKEQTDSLLGNEPKKEDPKPGLLDVLKGGPLLHKEPKKEEPKGLVGKLIGQTGPLFNKALIDHMFEFNAIKNK